MPIISNFPTNEKVALAGKQDKLTGTKGQVVGFDDSGNAVAQAAPDTGVTTFKGRTGAVTPQSGDYTADQVGAAPTGHTHKKADISDFPSSMTPISHAVNADTYGLGTGSVYGHVKLSDSTSTTSGVSGGTAATPTAVKAAYDRATTVVATHNTDTASHEDIRQRIIGKNLLNNWYFIGGGSQQGGEQFPINRNGETEYIGSGYGIDRWKGNFVGFSASVVEGGVYLDIPSSGYLNQKIENVIALAGKTVTCSALVKNGINIKLRFRINGIVGNSGSYTDVNGNGLFSFTYTLPEDLESLDVEFGTSSNNALSGLLVSAKLELGPVQTLAHKEGDEWVLNEIPNFAEQYAICEQYSPITGEFVGSQHSNPNLLDNWYFIGGGSQQGGGQFPINQRGEKEYAGLIYGIDRWKGFSATAKVTIKDDSVNITHTNTGVSALLAQYLEGIRLKAGRPARRKILCKRYSTKSRMAL